MPLLVWQLERLPPPQRRKTFNDKEKRHGVKMFADLRRVTPDILRSPTVVSAYSYLKFCEGCRDVGFRV